MVPALRSRCRGHASSRQSRARSLEIPPQSTSPQLNEAAKSLGKWFQCFHGIKPWTIGAASRRTKLVFEQTASYTVCVRRTDMSGAGLRGLALPPASNISSAPMQPKTNGTVAALEWSILSADPADAQDIPSLQRLLMPMPMSMSPRQGQYSAPATLESFSFS